MTNQCATASALWQKDYDDHRACLREERAIREMQSTVQVWCRKPDDLEMMAQMFGCTPLTWPCVMRMNDGASLPSEPLSDRSVEDQRRLDNGDAEKWVQQQITLAVARESGVSVGDDILLDAAVDTVANQVAHLWLARQPVDAIALGPWSAKWADLPGDVDRQVTGGLRGVWQITWRWQGNVIAAATAGCVTEPVLFSVVPHDGAPQCRVTTVKNIQEADALVCKNVGAAND